MFFKSFGLVSGAVGQIFILGAIGYLLAKRDILTRQGMSVLSRLVIEVTLPAMIFSRLIQGFDFNLSPAWWIFPLTSLAVMFLGLLVGGFFINFIKKEEEKRQFLSLVTFQNAGYLPLALAAALLSPEEQGVMFIYIFLFLLGFNLIIWSLGVNFLTAHRKKKLELFSFFSPPVLATLITMALVGLGVNRFIPGVILNPLSMLGYATLPLAMLVVGGSLGLIQIRGARLKPVALLVLAKLLILPLLGVLFIRGFPLPRMFSLLLIMQLAMPSATSLSLIITHYEGRDLLVSQGILFTHLLSLITVPLFLSLALSG